MHTNTKLQKFNFQTFLRDVHNEINAAKQHINTLQDEYKQALREEIKSTFTHRENQNATTENASIYYIKNEESGAHHVPQMHGINIPPHPMDFKMRMEVRLQ